MNKKYEIGQILIAKTIDTGDIYLFQVESQNEDGIYGYYRYTGQESFQKKYFGYFPFNNYTFEEVF